jgi:hypothetical protein
MGTNMTYQIPPDALARFNDMVNTGRIIRGQWQSTDAQGRETACLLGALGSEITDTKHCPASYMPSWLAELTPAIDDNTSDENWPLIIKRYANLANQWHVLDEAAWERVKWKTIDASLIVAEPHDTHNVVAPVRVLIKRQLSGDPPMQDEWEAAWSAAAAAEARAAAAWAAEAEARAAAAAAAAAAAEARAAWSAAWSAAAASEAASEAAWDTIAAALFDALETEISNYV